MKKSQPPQKLYRQPHRVRRKKSILKNRFFQYGILFLILAISAFYFLIFSSVFQIDKIIITGEEKTSTQKIKNLIEKEIEKKVLFFPTKSIFLVNCKKIRENILNNFPVISEIKISRGFPHTLNIVVIERMGIVCWQQGGQYFLLDSEGIIFEKISEEMTNNLLKIELHKQQAAASDLCNSTEIKLGQKIIEKEKIAEILWIISELKQNLKISVDLIEIVSQERLNVKTNEGWEIYFNTGEDINWQITELDLLLQNKIPLEKRNALEYIDLRFSRVYYKYR